VTVRVVERGDPEMLLAVFEGNLGVLSCASTSARALQILISVTPTTTSSAGSNS
jgi:hypothetical protein